MCSNNNEHVYYLILLVFANRKSGLCRNNTIPSNVNWTFFYETNEPSKIYDSEGLGSTKRDEIKMKVAEMRMLRLANNWKIKRV